MVRNAAVSRAVASQEDPFGFRKRLQVREVGRNRFEIHLRHGIAPEILVGTVPYDAGRRRLSGIATETRRAIPRRLRTRDRRIRGPVHADAAVTVVRTVDDAVAARPHAAIQNVGKLGDGGERVTTDYRTRGARIPCARPGRCDVDRGRNPAGYVPANRKRGGTGDSSLGIRNLDVVGSGFPRSMRQIPGVVRKIPAVVFKPSFGNRKRFALRPLQVLQTVFCKYEARESAEYGEEDRAKDDAEKHHESPMAREVFHINRQYEGSARSRSL